MSLDACISELTASGEMTRDQADYIRDLYERLRGREGEAYGKAAADATAEFATLRKAEENAITGRRQSLLGIRKKLDMLDAMMTYKGKPGQYNFGKAGEALFAPDDRASYPNWETLYKVRRKEALELVNDTLERHSRNLLGVVRDKTGLDDLGRELRGEKTGNRSAAELADGVREAQALQLRQLNAAGATVRELKDRGAPQLYRPEKVQAAGREQWKADEKAALDLKKTIDFETGKPFTPDALDKFLDQAWETIRTDGANKREEGDFGGVSIANRHRDARVLVYKSHDAWQQIAEKYGNPNLFDALMGEFDRNARDIAAMEMFGPNPASSVRWLKDVVDKDAKMGYGAGSPQARRAAASSRKFQTFWDVISGESTRGGNNMLGWLGGTVRNVQVSSKLGSAVGSALFGDMATGALTRSFNGMPISKMLLGYAKGLSSRDAREAAARRGFIADQRTHNFSTQARFLNDDLSSEWSARMADAVMRGSGMNLVTDVGRQTFGDEVLANITDNRRVRFDQLDKDFRAMFERYGMDAGDWDAIRKTPLQDVGDGAEFILPRNFADRGLSDKLNRMIVQEMDHAVVTPGLRAKAFIAGFGARGTPQGELARTLLQFKSFPLTMMYVHAARLAAREGGWNKAKYLAQALLLTTLGGWASMQFHAIRKGQDPRPLNFRSLVAALQQGGGLGIYGDFLFGNRNRAGQGISSTLLGPSVQTADALSGLLTGAPILQAEGENVDYDKQLVRFLRTETPGSSLWYARLAFDRYLMDQWQSLADPNYRQSWRNVRNNAEKMGTDYWWEPGDTSPYRAPDFENAGPPR